VSKPRIGFVGVGGMGQMAHLQNYNTLQDQCEVVAIAEIRDDLRAKVAAKYAIPNTYKTHEEMLAKEKLDGIVAVQQFTLHGQLIPQLLEYGCPVITEKPIGRSVEVGKKIAEASAKGKGKLYVGYHKRSDPAVVFAKETIASWKQSGQFGNLRYVRITMPPGDWIASGFNGLLNATTWYGDQVTWDPLPAGMSEAEAKHYEGLVNFYVHQVNLARHLLGEDYKVQYADPTGTVLVANAASGPAITIEMQPFSNSMEWREEALVTFDKGWMHIRVFAPLTHNRAGEITVYEDAAGQQPREIRPTMPHLHAMRSQAMNFIRAIKGEATPLCSAEDAVKDLIALRDYMQLYIQARGGKL
jgi:predicted dehydrogenase